MGCINSKGSPGHFILDNDKEGIHLLDGDENDYVSDFFETKLLGEGEFGQVKLVTSTTGHLKGKEFASKSIKKGYTFKNNTILTPIKPEHIRRECLILKELAGKRHTMDLVALYESASAVYMITELLSGGEMGDWIVNKQTKELRTEDVSRIAYEMIDAIDYCHSKGIIHRDLKPENVMFTDLSDSAPLKVIDWGSSSLDASTPDYRHHTFAGSAFYVSPEMFLQMNKTDKTGPYSSKTDIWSIGVTLYVLVAGYPADKLQKAFNVIQKPPSQDRDLTLLPNLPDDLPNEFMNLLNKCLEYRHKSRSTANELLNHEFVQFHRSGNLRSCDDDEELEEQGDGLDLSQVLSVANGGDLTTRSSPTTSSRKTMRSRALKGSVARHSMYLDFTKYERALTSLLAAVLSETEYENLINVLESLDSEHENSLKVIPVKDLKKVLEKDFSNNITVLSAMEKLKGSFLYEDYAYHISKLRLFSTQKKTFKMDDSTGTGTSSHHKISASDHKGQRSITIVRNHSVYGSNIYSSWAKDKSAVLKHEAKRDLGNNRASVHF